MRIQRIVETITCDACGNDASEHDTYLVVICAADRRGPMPQPRRLDLCATCSPAVDALRILVSKLPAVESKTKTDVAEARRSPARVDVRDGARVDCPLCRREVATKWLAKHLRRVHDADVKQPTKCPDCSKRIASAASMIRHRTMGHGYRFMDALIASAHVT